MKTELILKSDVLDIVFDNRNKAYGAYDLRKFYDNRLMKSLGMMIAVVIVLSAFTFIPKNKTVDAMEYVIPPNEWGNVKPKEPKKEIKPVVSEPKKLPPALTQKFLSNIKIVPEKDTTDKLAKDISNIQISNATSIIIATGNPGIFQPADPGTGGDGKGKEPAKEPELAPNIPRDGAEVMPSYPGGMDALRKFLQRNLTNPKEMEEGEEVSVKVKFVVGYDGKLQSFVTVQDGGEEFNKEVMRVLKKMPNWEPGKSNGQNVAVYYTIPVKFVSAN
jgi:protein TonB